MNAFRFFTLVVAGLLAISPHASAADGTAPASPKPVLAGTDGIVSMHASNAVVHGTMLRYEPQTNKLCLGFWTKAEDWAEWKFEIAKPGDYVVEIWQGCGKGQGGSDVIAEVAGKSFPFVVEDSGGFQNFIPRRVGTVAFGAGTHTIAVKPQNKKKAAVMDIRFVKIIPKGWYDRRGTENEILSIAEEGGYSVVLQYQTYFGCLEWLAISRGKGAAKGLVEQSFEGPGGRPQPEVPDYRRWEGRVVRPDKTTIELPSSTQLFEMVDGTRLVESKERVTYGEFKAYLNKRQNEPFTLEGLLKFAEQSRRK